MKTYIIKITAILLIMTGSFSCDKDDIDMSKIDFSNIENLYEQPLSVIKKAVQGKWKVYVRYERGIVGISYPQNEFIEINEDISWEKYSVKISENNIVQTYVTWNTELNEPWMYFTSIKNDTLGVGTFSILHTGCLLVRVK